MVLQVAASARVGVRSGERGTASGSAIPRQRRGRRIPGNGRRAATAEPQATADNREDEFAEAGGAEDPADQLEDERAEAERGEDSTDDLEDEFAEAVERKDYARELEDEFYEEADSPETGEEKDAAADFEAQQRAWAEANARMEESLRDNSIALILPNWSPSKLELGPVPQMPEIREQLLVVEKLSGLAMDFFGVWSLSPAFLKQLRFSVPQRERPRIADILRDSLDKDCSLLDGLATGSPPAPATFAEAVGAWKASAASDYELFRAEKWKTVQECLQRDLIDPLMKQADEATDPLLRNQMVVVASLNSIAHQQLLSLAAAAASPGGAKGPTEPRELPVEAFKQMLALTDRFRIMMKDIQSCRTMSKSKLAALAGWKKIEPSAPNSEPVPATSTKTKRSS